MPASSALASSRSPRTAVAPSDSTFAAEASLRARAATSTPRARKAGISRLPTNPDPPVMNARFTRRNLLGSASMSESQDIRHADGRVELRAPDELTASPLYNHDLAPVAIRQRTWSTWDYAALWISMAHCIPTY